MRLMKKIFFVLCLLLAGTYACKTTKKKKSSSSGPTTDPNACALSLSLTEPEAGINPDNLPVISKAEVTTIVDPDSVNTGIPLLRFSLNQKASDSPFDVIVYKFCKTQDNASCGPMQVAYTSLIDQDEKTGTITVESIEVNIPISGKSYYVSAATALHDHNVSQGTTKKKAERGMYLGTFKSFSQVKYVRSSKLEDHYVNQATKQRRLINKIYGTCHKIQKEMIVTLASGKKIDNASTIGMQTAINDRDAYCHQLVSTDPDDIQDFYANQEQANLAELAPSQLNLTADTSCVSNKTADQINQQVEDTLPVEEDDSTAKTTDTTELTAAEKKKKEEDEAAAAAAAAAALKQAQEKEATERATKLAEAEAAAKTAFETACKEKGGKIDGDNCYEIATGKQMSVNGTMLEDQECGPHKGIFADVDDQNCTCDAKNGWVQKDDGTSDCEFTCDKQEFVDLGKTIWGFEGCQCPDGMSSKSDGKCGLDCSYPLQEVKDGSCSCVANATATDGECLCNSGFGTGKDSEGKSTNSCVAVVPSGSKIDTALLSSMVVLTAGSALVTAANFKNWKIAGGRKDLNIYKYINDGKFAALLERHAVTEEITKLPRTASNISMDTNYKAPSRWEKFKQKVSNTFSLHNSYAFKNVSYKKVNLFVTISEAERTQIRSRYRNIGLVALAATALLSVGIAKGSGAFLAASDDMAIMTVLKPFIPELTYLRESYKQNGADYEAFLAKLAQK